MLLNRLIFQSWNNIFFHYLRFRENICDYIYREEKKVDKILCKHINLTSIDFSLTDKMHITTIVENVHKKLDRSYQTIAFDQLYVIGIDA